MCASVARIRAMFVAQSVNRSIIAFVGQRKAGKVCWQILAETLSIRGASGMCASFGSLVPQRHSLSVHAIAISERYDDAHPKSLLLSSLMLFQNPSDRRSSINESHFRVRIKIIIYKSFLRQCSPIYLCTQHRAQNKNVCLCTGLTVLLSLSFSLCTVKMPAINVGIRAGNIGCHAVAGERGQTAPNAHSCICTNVCVMFKCTFAFAQNS